MALLEQLNKRYATKKFDASKKIASADLTTLLEAIRLSASSYGLQAYKVLVVENEAIRKQLRAASWDQSQITDASQLLVFAVETNFDEKGVDKFVENTATTRKIEVSALSGYADMMKGSLKRPAEDVRVFAQKEIPQDIPEFKTDGKKSVLLIMTESGLVKSGNEGRRLLKQGGVFFNNEKIDKENFLLTSGILKVGSRRFLKISQI